MNIKRWEDDAVVWTGPHYKDEILKYNRSVKTGYATGRIISCVDVVDWSALGTKDLIISSWDPCYDGQAYLRRQIGVNDDGTPLLGGEQLIDGVRGYVTAVQDGDIFHLVSASRMRSTIHIYPNVGVPGAPQFGEPVVLKLDADWVKGNEYYHMARFADIDGDGELELIVGSDSWDDYWPNGLEWNDDGYRGYDNAGRWLGGPLRGYLYAFKFSGDVTNPTLAKGAPVQAGANALEVYGQLAPAFGDFFGTGNLDVVCGEFWNILHLAKARGSGGFDRPALVSRQGNGPVKLEHCIHMPCVVDWDGDGRPDILVGAEDGYITFVKNIGLDDKGVPVFENRGRIETTEPIVHANVLPSPAVYRKDKNARPDLIVGNCTGELLFYETARNAGETTLLREQRLRAGGAEIRVRAGLTGSPQGPSEKMFGYTCPVVADWCGPGAQDVLMSSVLGTHVLLENTGGAYPPDFNKAVALTVNGDPLKTVWRVRPAVVDWIGNGRLHYLALDDQGRLSDWTKQSKTELSDKRYLHWDTGEGVTFTQDFGGGRGRVKLCAVDWTGNGLTDLIIGTHARASVPPGPSGQPRHTTGQAGILYLKNVGTNAEAVFAAPVAMRFKGEVIEMGMHACSPEAVDWNGNGELGLIVGVEDGSLVWLDRAHLSWDVE